MVVRRDIVVVEEFSPKVSFDSEKTLRCPSRAPIFTTPTADYGSAFVASSSSLTFSTIKLSSQFNLAHRFESMP